MKPAPIAAFAAACLMALARPAVGQGAEPVPDISLEDLVNTEVVSASRRIQNLQQVAAAVFVISQDDIARSGARSLADVLAMAPGIEVARLGNNRWAVSARGFNGRFANKLQVLKDGRSIYSPLFSGVFWEAEDTILEDIERIEIIRGPNAAMWGSNAVNGTINIITRKARETQGGLVAVSVGSEDRHNLTARYGMPLGDAGYLRVYGKSVDRRAGFAPGGERATDWGETGIAGFRADWLLSSGNRLSVNGEAYRDRNADTYEFPDATRPPAYVGTLNSVMSLSGGHLQGRYESLRDDGSELVLQSYFTHRVLEAERVLREERDTFDVDAQYRFAPGGDHDLMLGANYRTSTDTTTSPPGSYVTFADAGRPFRLASVFFNDEIALVRDRLSVTVGARLEHNNYSGTDVQPTARFLWTPNPRQTVWGAVSHATRTPSRAEGAASIPLRVVPPAPPFVPVPTLISYRNSGTATQSSEKMDAAEIGYRHRFSTALSIDATAFVHRYRDVVTVVPGARDMSFLPTYVLMPVASDNGERARIHGLEISAFAQMTPAWRLLPSYTWMQGSASGLGDDFSEASARGSMLKMPRSMLSLRSQHNLGAAGQLDFWLKSKSRNEDMGIPGRTNLDICYAWKPQRALELSLAGYNLLHRRTLEYRSDALPSVPVETGRGVSLRAEYRF